MRTVYGDHQRFVDTYFKQFPGMYFTGDGARRDEDGYYWITGRVDDVINVSGHRLGTAEVESALVGHPKVAEAAVVGFPHDLKGQGIYAYVTLKAGETPSDALRKELVAWVRKEIGAIATPDVIQWAPSLPKTRSGKIMRRILRKIAANDFKELGDTSTLADPAVVDDLIKNRATTRLNTRARRGRRRPDPLSCRLEVGRRVGASAEEELLHLVLEELARLRLDRRQAVLVEQHRLVLDPALPRELRHVLVDALPERAGIRRPVEAFGVRAEQDAGHFSCHTLTMQARRPPLRSAATGAGTPTASFAPGRHQCQSSRSMTTDGDAASSSSAA